MLEKLAERFRKTSYTGKRRLIAVAGPPASGKSTLAAALADTDPSFAPVPMDGFHLHNSILEERGLLTRKGAPETFDAPGFLHLIRRLEQEDEVFLPIFDRDLDHAIAGAFFVGPEVTTVIVEGNYLLLDRPIWRDLSSFWHLSILLSAPLDVLRERLTKRWLDLGYKHSDALVKMRENDVPNAELVIAHSLPANIVLNDGEVSGLLT